MKINYTKKVEADAKWLHVYCGGRLDYERFNLGDETYESQDELLNAYPELAGSNNGFKQLLLKIDIETGKVINWPIGKPCDFHDMKVVDEGQYVLLDKNLNKIISYENYVPNCLGRGGWGDYFEFEINKEGFIERWGFGQSDVNEFFGVDE